MFGWLAAFGASDRLRPSTSGARLRHVAPQRLAHLLPALGSVLHLSGRATPLPLVQSRVVTEHAFLQPLLATCWLHAASTVTVEGPREWIDCIGDRGAVLARLYLLPDTDYLAWDALLAEGAAASASARPQPFRATQARLLRFTHRPLACFGVLGGDAPLRVSTLGRRLANEIARDESVALPAASTAD